MSTDPPIRVNDLSVAELAAVMRNDTDFFPDAGRVEVPAALERLRELARRRDFEEGDSATPLETLAAGKALEELELAEERPIDTAGAAAAASNGIPADPADTTELLEATGYRATRGQIIGAVQGILNVDLELLDATIAFAVAGQRKLEARGDVPRDRLELVANEVALLRATRYFRRELDKLAEGAEAREAILRG